MKNTEQFKPFVPASKVMPEITFTSVFIGIMAAVIFGAANAYLGLRVGMTVSASIPAAVISMGIMRIILKRDSILENNIVQTIGSAGESVAAGAIFTLPAMFIWQNQWTGENPSPINIFLISVLSAILGVCFMVPLRKALIVKEHGVLPYPEGTACAEVLIAGEEGGNKASTVFAGLGISALYKFIADGLKIFPSEIHFEQRRYKGGGFGVDVLPALLGVGYICGIKISSYMFAGGILGWLVIMPLLSLFGGDISIYPANVPISEMDSFGIWSSYIRYIGAGAVAAGGIISLVKSAPLIWKTFIHAIKDFRKTENGLENEERTQKDLPMNVIALIAAAIILLIWLLPSIPVNIIGAFIIAVFGFFFATVSSRLVGLVGSSNNPVSGMAIATLLISSVVLKASGLEGQSAMMGAIAIGSVICIIGAIAGDTSQDLKTGFILGASPFKQQIGEFIGSIAASAAIGGILFLLNAAWGFDSPQLPAPQATLMRLVVEGVVDGNLPWNLVIAGVFIAIIAEILKIPVLPFAVGLYLPIHLSTAIMTGGAARYVFDKMKNEKDKNEGGILYTSGLIAGEGLMGILLAIFAVIPFRKGSFADIFDLSDIISLGNAGGILFFLFLIFTVFYFAGGMKKSEKQK